MAETGYEFLDEIAIADVAFRAYGDSLEELLANAARATIAVMVEDPDSIRRETARSVRIRERCEEMLLFELLQELIIVKDAESLLLLPEALEVHPDNGGWLLDATLSGEPIDPERHALNVDVKAVTMHRFDVTRDDDGWHAEVVLDI